MPQQTDEALVELCRVVEQAQQRLEAVRVRAAHLLEERGNGRTYADIVEHEERPLVVELLSTVLDELSSAGAAFRRAEARALHQDGMSQETIARLFGVTRQRVGALLQSSQRD